MKLIELTEFFEGSRYNVNPESIAYVTDSWDHSGMDKPKAGTHCVIYFNLTDGPRCIGVKESREQVVNLINYQLERR